MQQAPVHLFWILISGWQRDDIDEGAAACAALHGAEPDRGRDPQHGHRVRRQRRRHHRLWGVHRDDDHQGVGRGSGKKERDRRHMFNFVPNSQPPVTKRTAQLTSLISKPLREAICNVGFVSAPHMWRQRGGLSQYCILFVHNYRPLSEIVANQTS